MFSVAASANDSSQCWKTLTRIPTILHTRNKPAGSRARMSTQPVSGERSRIGVQERLDVCDGLRVVPELDGVDAEGAGGGYVRLHIIQEDHLLRLHAQALAGQREDAWVWLGDPFFVRIDDEFSHLRKVKTLLFCATRADEAVADDRRPAVGVQTGEIGDQFVIGVAIYTSQKSRRNAAICASSIPVTWRTPSCHSSSVQVPMLPSLPSLASRASSSSSRASNSPGARCSRASHVAIIGAKRRVGSPPPGMTSRMPPISKTTTRIAMPASPSRT